jgi:pilus assembly protein CpaE
LGRGDADLVLVNVDHREQQSWQALQGAKALTEARILAVGASRDERVISRARDLGISEVLDNTNLRESLDDALDQSVSQGLHGRRGKVISVFAPTPGSGATTVACNLAGALSAKYPNEVALIELSREFGDLAVMLDIEPRYSASEVCRRWRTLDTTTLVSSFTEHASGLRVLANDVESTENEFLDRHAVRRISILSRVCQGFTVLTLDSRLAECEVEAMRLSDAVVLVVRPDVVSVRRAFRALIRAGELEMDRDRFRLVVNRFGQPGQLPLKEIETTLGLQAVVLIPEDSKSVNRAVNQGSLLVEGSQLRKINRTFASLAGKLNGRAPSRNRNGS